MQQRGGSGASTSTYADEQTRTHGVLPPSHHDASTHPLACHCACHFQHLGLTYITKPRNLVGNLPQGLRQLNLPKQSQCSGAPAAGPVSPVSAALPDPRWAPGQSVPRYSSIVHVLI